jgi:hypothetical protein
MALFFLAHARTCAARLLDRCAHTAHTQPTAIVGPVPTVLGRSHCCNPSTVCPSDSSKPHPCVTAALHLLHTRPPDIHVACLVYQRLLSNIYFSLGLWRPLHTRSCYRAHAITSSGAGVDLPGFGLCSSYMSDREEGSPAAHGALGGSARTTADCHDEDHHCPWHKSDFPSDNATFEQCSVK